MDLIQIFVLLFGIYEDLRREIALLTAFLIKLKLDYIFSRYIYWNCITKAHYIYKDV